MRKPWETMSVSVKVPVDQDQRSHQSPHVESDADPAGGDLDPHGGPLARHGFVVGVGAATENTIQNSIPSELIS